MSNLVLYCCFQNTWHTWVFRIEKMVTFKQWGPHSRILSTTTLPHCINFLSQHAQAMNHKIALVWRGVCDLTGLGVRGCLWRLWGFSRIFSKVFSLGVLHYLSSTIPYKLWWWQYWASHRYRTSVDTVPSLTFPSYSPVSIDTFNLILVHQTYRMKFFVVETHATNQQNTQTLPYLTAIMRGRKISTDLKYTILALGSLHLVSEIAALTVVSRCQIHCIQKTREMTGCVEPEHVWRKIGWPHFLTRDEEVVRFSFTPWIAPVMRNKISMWLCVLKEHPVFILKIFNHNWWLT